VNVGDAGDIPPRSREARDKPARDWIVAHDHDDRNRRRCSLDDRGLLPSVREEHVRAEADKLRRQDWEALVLSFGVPIVQGERLAVHVAKDLQLLEARCDDRQILLGEEEYADAPVPIRPLRSGRQWPGQQTPRDGRDEGPSGQAGRREGVRGVPSH
jgi:hypothetical protein